MITASLIFVKHYGLEYPNVQIEETIKGITAVVGKVEVKSIDEANYIVGNIEEISFSAENTLVSEVVAKFRKLPTEWIGHNSKGMAVIGDLIDRKWQQSMHSKGMGHSPSFRGRDDHY